MSQLFSNSIVFHRVTYHKSECYHAFLKFAAMYRLIYQIHQYAARNLAYSLLLQPIH